MTGTWSQPSHCGLTMTWQTSKFRIKWTHTDLLLQRTRLGAGDAEREDLGHSPQKLSIEVGRFRQRHTYTEIIQDRLSKE